VLSGSFVEAMQRLCHRCHHALTIDDENALIFCYNCGAPQVTLSEELLEQAQKALETSPERIETEAERSERIAAQPPDLLVIWKSIIRIAALVSGVISLICLALPLEILAWLAPGIVLSVYCARHRETKITTAVGARIGLVCGILCGFGITVAKAVQMLVVRFGLHQGGSLDKTLVQAITQAKARAIAQSGQAAAGAIFNPLLNVPEFRVGFYMFALLFGISILIALSIASGAFSGFMRSRRPIR
jgi:hypothetical protein